MFLVKARRLKTVGGQDNLMALPTHCLLLHSSKQGASEALTPQSGIYPEVHDLTAATPSVATDCGDDIAVIILDGRVKKLAVGDASRLAVERVDAAVE